jgi:hypothetical protein
VLSWENFRVHFLSSGKHVEFILPNEDSGRPPVWSSGQSFWLQTQRTRVRFPALPDFLRSSGSETGSTQPREDN